MTKVKPVRPKLSFLSAIAKLNLDQTVYAIKIWSYFTSQGNYKSHTGCQVGHQGHVDGADDQGLHPRLP